MMVMATDSSNALTTLTTKPSMATSVALAEGNLCRLQQADHRLTAIPSAIIPNTKAEANPARSPTLPVPKLNRGFAAWRLAKA